MRSGNFSNPAFFYGWKDSRKVSGKMQSIFHLEDQDGKPVLSFEIEHQANKGYPNGGFCPWVKKGFPLSGDEKIAVKKLTDKLPKELTMYYAMRAALFGRAMGDVTLPFIYEDGVYVTMNFFEGRSLSGLYNNNRAYLVSKSVDDRLKYVVDILAELTSLHDVDCIHRDIKPGNIMISDQAAKLIDLDGAFMEGEETFLQSFTFPYLSRDNQKLLLSCGIRNLRTSDIFSKKSDLYALGLTLCVLYSDLFWLDNSPPCVYAEDGTSMITVTKNNLARAKHDKLASFFISLLKNNCRYTSAREVLIGFIDLCQAEYKKDFWSALTPTRMITKEELKSALFKVRTACDKVNQEQQVYTARFDYQKRRFIQPKAIIPSRVLFSDEMKKLLAEMEPRNYRQFFKNIMSTVSSLDTIDRYIQLYRETLALLPGKHKFIFLCACLGHLYSINTGDIDEIVQFWLNSLDSFGKLEPSINVICKFIRIANLQSRSIIAPIMSRYYEIVTQSEMTAQRVFKSLSSADKLSIYELYFSRFQLSDETKLILLNQLSFTQRVSALMDELRCVRTRQDQLVLLRFPALSSLAQVITGEQLERLEHALVPRDPQDGFAIIIFFGQLQDFPALARKMQGVQLSSEEKIQLALSIDPSVMAEFYNHYVSSDDLHAENLLPLIHRLPLQNQLSFLSKHAEKIRLIISSMLEEDAQAQAFQAICLSMRERVTIDNLTVFLTVLHPMHRFAFVLEHLQLMSVGVDLKRFMELVTDADYLFLTARQQIMRRLVVYRGEKPNLHDDRVAFIYDKVSQAQSLQALAHIITGNGFDAPSGLGLQFAGRTPKHRLFSYGFSDLLKSCMSILEGLPAPLAKDTKSGFYIL